MIPRPGDWSEHAACADPVHQPAHGNDPWFEPEGREHLTDRRLREGYVLALCRTCPVIEQCRKDARMTDAEWGYHGIRAGLRADERRHQDRRSA